MLQPAKAHAFVEDVARPQLSSADGHHLERVLRLRPGDAVTVADGAGRWRACRLAAGGVLEPEGDIVQEARPDPPVAVAFALTKGERPEWTVQKLTELGVDTIVPFLADRSVVRWNPARAATHSDRFRRIAREAAGQCRRAWLPEVEDVARFADLIARSGAALADLGGKPPSLAHPVVLVGPEGGWSDGELAAAGHLPRVILGSHVLRAETAALAAAALLCGLRAGVVEQAAAPQSSEKPRHCH